MITRRLNWWQVGGAGIIFLAIAYGFASWAIDSGQLWQYALAIVFLVGGIKGIIRATKSLFNK